jgi:hypothetical protein
MDFRAGISLFYFDVFLHPEVAPDRILQLHLTPNLAITNEESY